MSLNPFQPASLDPAQTHPPEANPVWTGLLVFFGCLVLSLGAVAWRTEVRMAKAQADARREALSLRNALEHEFNQAVTAAEVLGAVVQQADGNAPNFFRVAQGLLRTHPGVSSLELLPGGTLTVIVPWAGNEQAVGCRLANDTPRRIAANAAIRNRALTVAGPLRLYHGEPGLAVLVPIFTRGRDKPEALWGFVAASMKLNEALARAGANYRSGYHFQFSAPDPHGRGPIILAARGRLSPGAVEESVPVRNLEFRLALQRPGGWLNRPRLVLDLVAALLGSGLVGVSTGLWLNRGTQRATSSRLAQRLAEELEARNKAQADLETERLRLQSVQSESKKTQTAHRELEIHLAQLKTRLEQAERRTTEAATSAQERLTQAEARAGELEIRLDTEIRANRDARLKHHDEIAGLMEKLGQLKTEKEALEAKGVEIPAAAANPPPTEEPSPAAAAGEDAPTPSLRRAPSEPLADVSQLKQAVHEMVPLLVDQDPGAIDCLQAHQASFRAAFGAEVCLEFERLVSHGEYRAGLEQLKKAARKHGVSI